MHPFLLPSLADERIGRYRQEAEEHTRRKAGRRREDGSTQPRSRFSRRRRS
jgi:hypothetical protein